jgi:hypothetical protein
MKQSQGKTAFLNAKEAMHFLLKNTQTAKACHFLLPLLTVKLLQKSNKKAFFAPKTFPAPGPSGGIHPTSAQAVVPDLPALGIFWSGFFV